jgi:RNA polymerase sigma factor (sigma-70 family)
MAAENTRSTEGAYQLASVDRPPDVISEPAVLREATEPSALGERPLRVFAAVERNRKRLWAICYRMTGQRADADELAQEAIARAIERADQATGDDPTGWLLRLTTRLCIDHLRRHNVQRRVNELVDPLHGDEWSTGEGRSRAPEASALLREDLRYAVVVALQRLSSRQRAVLILHDVCERSFDEIAELLETNSNAARAVLHRARAALSAARLHETVDIPVDRDVVERFAQAIEAGAVDQLAELLAADVWGVADGGGIIQTAKKPTFGKRAVSRQWANGKRKLGQPVTAEIVVLNGEPAIIVRLAAMQNVIVAVVHLETRAERVVALRVNRDPRRFACAVPSTN